MPSETKTRRIYLNVGTTRPYACFEVTRRGGQYLDQCEFSAELISGDVDMAELEDYECEAIAQAREEWALEWARADRETRAFAASNRAMLRGINEA